MSENHLKYKCHTHGWKYILVLHFKDIISLSIIYTFVQCTINLQSQCQCLKTMNKGRVLKECQRVTSIYLASLALDLTSSRVSRCLATTRCQVEHCGYFKFSLIFGLSNDVGASVSPFTTFT